jgi:peroxiredoxin Q/BCP
MALEPGKKAPEFSLTADDGKTVRLADFKGKRVVLFFFPKANTGG